VSLMSSKCPQLRVEIDAAADKALAGLPAGYILPGARRH